MATFKTVHVFQESDGFHYTKGYSTSIPMLVNMDEVLWVKDHPNASILKFKNSDIEYSIVETIDQMV